MLNKSSLIICFAMAGFNIKSKVVGMVERYLVILNSFEYCNIVISNPIKK